MKRFALTASLALAACFSACSLGDDSNYATVPGGSVERGRQAIELYGCGSCHTIPAVNGATALVGPSLEHVANRSYVAGVMVNRPENMIAWIFDPPKIDPLTAMPRLGVTEQDARDIASYLYTLR
jgi:cytochrome c